MRIFQRAVVVPASLSVVFMGLVAYATVQTGRTAEPIVEETVVAPSPLVLEEPRAPVISGSPMFPVVVAAVPSNQPVSPVAIVSSELPEPPAPAPIEAVAPTPIPVPESAPEPEWDDREDDEEQDKEEDDEEDDEDEDWEDD